MHEETSEAARVDLPSDSAPAQREEAGRDLVVPCLKLLPSTASDSEAEERAEDPPGQGVPVPAPLELHLATMGGGSEPGVGPERAALPLPSPGPGHDFSLPAPGLGPHGAAALAKRQENAGRAGAGESEGKKFKGVESEEAEPKDDIEGPRPRDESKGHQTPKRRRLSASRPGGDPDPLNSLAAAAEMAQMDDEATGSKGTQGLGGKTGRTRTRDRGTGPGADLPTRTSTPVPSSGRRRDVARRQGKERASATAPSPALQRPPVQMPPMGHPREPKGHRGSPVGKVRARTRAGSEGPPPDRDRTPSEPPSSPTATGYAMGKLRAPPVGRELEASPGPGSGTKRRRQRAKREVEEESESESESEEEGGRGPGKRPRKAAKYKGAGTGTVRSPSQTAAAVSPSQHDRLPSRPAAVSVEFPRPFPSPPPRPRATAGPICRRRGEVTIEDLLEVGAPVGLRSEMARLRVRTQEGARGSAAVNGQGGKGAKGGTGGVRTRSGGGSATVREERESGAKGHHGEEGSWVLSKGQAARDLAIIQEAQSGGQEAPAKRERQGTGDGPGGGGFGGARGGADGHVRGLGNGDPAPFRPPLPPIPGPEGKGGLPLVNWMRESPANAKKVTSFLSQVLWRARDAPAACYPVDRVPYEELRGAITDVQQRLIKGTLEAMVVEDLADFLSVALGRHEGSADLDVRLVDDLLDVLELHGFITSH